MRRRYTKQVGEVRVRSASGPRVLIELLNNAGEVQRTAGLRVGGPETLAVTHSIDLEVSGGTQAQQAKEWRRVDQAMRRCGFRLEAIDGERLQ